jgi:hypothetical protein
MLNLKKLKAFLLFVIVTMLFNFVNSVYFVHESFFYISLLGWFVLCLIFVNLNEYDNNN